MRSRLKLTALLLAGTLFLPLAALADTPPAHRVHKAKKQPPLPPPLPSGTQGPVPQVPLDAIPAVPPEVSYENGMLTIVAQNSTLSDILRSVRKQTSADIEIPATASERVVTRLGPGPAREIMAELLNGSRFNYVLLGSPDNASTLVRVVLVAKTPDTPPGQPGPATAANANGNDNASAELSDDAAAAEDGPDQPAAEAEQPAPAADQPPPKTPQQLLQEMQQRQMQQGIPGQFPGRPGAVIPPGQPPQPQDPPQ